MSRKKIIQNYHADAIETFRTYKKLAERAMEQVSDEEFFRTIDAESNSIALMVKHIAGNLRSRWTDFLESDGEKPDRNRDTEFEIIGDSREGLMGYWNSCWDILFESLGSLKQKHFERKVLIRGEKHTVAEAINRQMTHYAYHVGQIVFLSKHFRSSDWKTLSVPRNSSARFNQFLADKQAAGEQLPPRMDAPMEFVEADDENSEMAGSPVIPAS